MTDLRKVERFSTSDEELLRTIELSLSTKRTGSLMDEKSPLLAASSSKNNSSNTLRRHESLPTGPFESVKEKPRLRKLGTFSTTLTNSNGK